MGLSMAVDSPPPRNPALGFLAGLDLTHQDVALRHEADGRPKTDDHGGDRLLAALMQAHPERAPQIGSSGAPK